MPPILKIHFENRDATYIIAFGDLKMEHTKRDICSNCWLSNSSCVDCPYNSGGNNNEWIDKIRDSISDDRGGDDANDK